MQRLFGHPSLFSETLKKKLAEKLPGEAAQNRMSSRVRMSTEEYLLRFPGYRTSSVLMMFFPIGKEIGTLLIERPGYEGVHSGQLALPGGKKEPGDADDISTALRETEEEVGVHVERSAVLGKLTPLYIPPSNFLVHPFVSFLPERPQWKADPDEVADIIEVPLSVLFDDKQKGRERIPVGKNLFVDAPCYLPFGKVLWGATAMMFAEMETLLKR
ncbi:MAG TPA: CoA pyrophosphatase [Bacteroidia bacterium]|nr:CoA pyrophosphatase [Bacteroidia bacterium]